MNFDPNVLLSRNMYVIVLQGGNLGSIVPEIAQQSVKGQRICAQLTASKSYRDWEALFRDLVTLCGT